MSERVFVDRQEPRDERESVVRVSDLYRSDGNAGTRVETERAEARGCFDKVSLVSDSRGLRSGRETKCTSFTNQLEYWWS